MDDPRRQHADPGLRDEILDAGTPLDVPARSMIVLRAAPTTRSPHAVDTTDGRGDGGRGVRRGPAGTPGLPSEPRDVLARRVGGRRPRTAEVRPTTPPEHPRRPGRRPRSTPDAAGAGEGDPPRPTAARAIPPRPTAPPPTPRRPTATGSDTTAKRPDDPRRIPASTYRLQITADFDLAAAPTSSTTSATWAPTGSTSPPCCRPRTGLPARLRRRRPHARRLPSAAATRRSAPSPRPHTPPALGALVDIVPNHVGVATPEANMVVSLLEQGHGSPVALGVRRRLGSGRRPDPDPRPRRPLLDAVELRDGRLFVGETAYPTAPGTVQDGDTVEARAQRGSTTSSCTGSEPTGPQPQLPRFFAVNTLAAIRVEEPEVFAASHATIGAWFEDGLVDGLRIDHPDGLYDPAGYLEDLAALTAARTPSSRRSSSRARRCRARGRWTARPATTRSACSTGSSSTPRARPH